MLVEPELEGKFTKWNNNAGSVRRPQPAARAAPPRTPVGGSFGLGLMGIIQEGDSDEEDEDGTRLPGPRGG